MRNIKVSKATIALSALVLCAIYVSGAYGQDHQAHYKGLAGKYVREPAESDWHHATIEVAPSNEYKWTNKFGKSWAVWQEWRVSDGKKEDFWLKFKDGPYAGHRLVMKRDADGKVTKLIEYKDEGRDGTPMGVWLKQ